MKKIYNVLLTTACIANINAQSLDLTFNSTGHNSITVTNSVHIGQRVHQQQDGKLILSGVAGAGSSNYDFFALRFLTNGNIDSSYALNGVKQIAFGTGYDELLSSAMQKDGKLVLCGGSNTGSIGMAIARLDNTGAPDNGFAAGGKYFNALLGESYAYDMAMQNDGKIILVGSTRNAVSSGNRKEAILRLDVNGSLDNTFNTNGVLINNIDSLKTVEARCAAIDSNQNILIGSGGNLKKAMLTKITPNGTLDITFGNNGNLQLSVTAGFNGIYDILIQPDGKYLVYLEDSINYLVRLLPSGILDNTFNGNGKAPIDSASGCRLALQPDGKIVLVSTIYNFTTFQQERILYRFNSNGTIDNTFGTNGKYRDLPKVLNNGNGILIQQDGKIVLSGSRFNLTTFNGEMGLSRYNNTYTSSLKPITNNQINFYPNPAHEFIIINTLKIEKINIYNTLGAIIKKITLQEGKNSINIQDLKSGIYFLRIGNGETLKFIKE